MQAAIIARGQQTGGRPRDKSRLLLRDVTFLVAFLGRACAAMLSAISAYMPKFGSWWWWWLAGSGVVLSLLFVFVPGVISEGRRWALWCVLRGGWGDCGCFSVPDRVSGRSVNVECLASFLTCGRFFQCCIDGVLDWLNC